MNLRSHSQIKPPAAAESYEWDDDEPLTFVIERLRDRRARSNEEEGDDDGGSGGEGIEGDSDKDYVTRESDWEDDDDSDEDYEVESGKRRMKGSDVAEELQGIGFDSVEEFVHQALVDDVIQNVAHEEVERITKL